MADATNRLQALEETVQFVLSKCVCSDAGTTGNPYAYLWKRDWDKFEEMASQLGIVKAD